MAALERRLLLLAPPASVALRRPDLRRPPSCLSSRPHLRRAFLSAVAASSVPVAAKKKLPPASPERLKRRTRSDAAAFDAETFRRYAAGGAHVPVLLCEVLRAFRRRRPLQSFVDCTLGAAAHSAAVIAEHPEMELFVGMDVDPAAHCIAKARLEALLDQRKRNVEDGLKAYTHVANFKYIHRVLGGVDENLLASGVDGILIDLGMSSMQVDSADRGFGVLQDGPLDLRMDPQAALKAEDILNSWPETEVGRILREYGEESNWRSLQKQIVRARSCGGLRSTGELVQLIRRSSGFSGGRHGWIKTATRVFQALRIAVNDELRTLEDALRSSFGCLASGGRLAVISFHSLEDRIVKQTFLDLINGEEKEEDDDDDGGRDGIRCTGIDLEEEPWCKHAVEGKSGMVLAKRPITPSEEEERLNPRCRSAKLRVIEKARR